MNTPTSMSVVYVKERFVYLNTPDPVSIIPVEGEYWL